ncbi:MAG: DnaA regulatory inactivator Hda [Thiotrichaceae bacterium]
MPTQQPLLNLSLPDSQRFETFYAGVDNQLVVEDLQSLLTSNDHRQNFIWGGENSGKSHLLQATCYAAFSKGMSAAYLPLRDLKQHGVEIFTGSSSYRLICIDDVDSVIGNDNWELALFNLINQARERQQILIFSATENPRHMNCNLADLQSRLLWGTNYQLKELNDEEKSQALKFRASHRGIALDNAVIEYIYKRYPRDFTTLISILDKLDVESLSSQRKITIPLVKQALEQDQP